jgi:hypothetical protein
MHRMRGGYSLRFTFLSIFVALACTRAEPERGPATPSATSEPAPNTAAPQSERNITIETVEIANPVVVTGRARTFENNVVIRVLAEDDTLVARTFTTSDGEMGQHNPYRATLWITRDPGRQITVEALEHSAKDGSEQSLVAFEKPFDVAIIEAKLYFPDVQCTRVDPHTRRLPNSTAMARLLVEALIAGPTPDESAAGAAAPFPEGARVESVNLRDGVLTVDFNERLRNVGGSCQAQMIRQSVTATLSALPSVKKVVITAAGSEALALQP